MLKSSRLSCGNLLLDLSGKDAFDRSGNRAKLQPRALAVLLHLAEHANQLVSRDELHTAIWGKKVVEPNALDQAIFQIRLALGDHDRTLLVSVPRRGFELRMDATLAQNSLTDVITASQDGSDLIDAQSLCVELPMVSGAPHFKPTNKTAWANKALGLSPVIALVLLVAWVLMPSFAPKTVSTTIPRDLRPPVYALAGTSPELVEIIKALCAGKQSKFQFVGLSDTSNRVDGATVFGIAGYGRGLIISKKDDSNFYLPEETRAALQSLLINETKEPIAASGTIVITRLMQTASFEATRKQLFEDLSAHPRDALVWQQLATVYRLSGRPAIAELLKAETEKSVPNPLQNFAEALASIKAETDIGVQLEKLRKLCQANTFEHNSWASGVCTLETALAEIANGELEQAALTLAYAARAFEKSGDSRSTALVVAIERIAFVSLDDATAIDVTTALQLDDLRAIGTVLTPLSFKQPQIVVELAERAIRSPNLSQDVLTATDIANVLGLAARRSHDLAIGQRAADDLERLMTNSSGELRASIASALIHLHWSNGNMLRAGRLLESQHVPQPGTFVCVRANISVTFKKLREALADADFCYANRNKKAFERISAGLMSAVARHSILRLMERTAELPAAMQLADQEFVAANRLRANFKSLARSYIREKYLSGHSDWVVGFCRKKLDENQEMCSDELVRKFDALLQRIPSEDLKLQPLDSYWPNWWDLLRDLFFEQARTQKCPAKLAELDKLVARMKDTGNLHAFQILESIREDCAKGRMAKVLMSWPTRPG
jgi:DNA-binding winged helix-turn-helix (wHTH) protein